MEILGKILSEYMESLFLITSLQLSEEFSPESKTYVTYRDGIIFDFMKDQSPDLITYRRNVYRKKELKESLLYSLMNLADEVTNTLPVLKWT